MVSGEIDCGFGDCFDVLILPALKETLVLDPAVPENRPLLVLLIGRPPPQSIVRVAIELENHHPERFKLLQTLVIR